MEIHLIREGRLKVALTKAEADSLSVDFEHFNLDCTEGRGLLISLLERGKEETGFSPKDSKLFVEIYPDREDGYVLYFTVLDQKAGTRNDIPWMRPSVFAFRSADDLCDGCSELSKRYGHRIIESYLYRYKNEYVLVIYPLDYSDRLSTYLLAEYSRKAGEGEILAAHIAEHGKPLIEGSAIETMVMYFP